MDPYSDFWNAIWSGDSKSHRAIIEKYFPPFANLKGLAQNPVHHPEGDVDEHVFLVIDALANDRDKDLSLAAIFHDLGKSNTYEINSETGQPTFHNHEKYSADYVKYYRDLIEDMGADYYMVFDLVGQHMKFHRRDEMKPSKQRDMEESFYFEKLKKLGEADHATRYA